jgi:hypothetical protein
MTQAYWELVGYVVLFGLIALGANARTVFGYFRGPVHTKDRRKALMDSIERAIYVGCKHDNYVYIFALPRHVFLGATYSQIHEAIVTRVGLSGNLLYKLMGSAV